VRGLLDGLGAEPATLPAGLEAQAALYRSMVADRRVLVVLDNALDTAQVTPLLPGSASCAVLITSRNQLTGLISTHDAGSLALPLLTDAEATDLLTRRLGHRRLTAEPDAAREIAHYCAGLPLALGIAAARVATGSSLATLADELRVARLDALDTEEPAASLRAVFSVSYTALDEETARALRLLALAPGADISLAAGRALVARDDARRLIRRLTAAHLVREHQPGRFHLHDLVRRYTTAELARDSDSLTHLRNYYLHAASVAMDHFTPMESYRRPAVTDPVRPAPEFATIEQARDWLDAERANLVAAGAIDDTGRLAMTLFRYLEAGAHYEDALTLHSHALAATGPDQPEHGYALLHRGTALADLDRTTEASTDHERALRLARTRGDTLLEACAAAGLAVVHEQRREGIVLNNLGDFYCIVGRYDSASDVLDQGLAVAWEQKDTALGAYVLANLGNVYERVGQREKAVPTLRRALDLARRLHVRGLELGVLNDLGRATDSPECYREALAIARDVGARAGESRAREGLARLRHTGATPPRDV
jgi:tetratricopeptide (TPR) repeat protein